MQGPILRLVDVRYILIQRYICWVTLSRRLLLFTIHDILLQLISCRRFELKVSISTGCLYFYPLHWAFDVMGEAGFDGFELALGPEAVLRGPATMRELVRTHDLHVLSVHPPLLPLPGWSSFADTAKIVNFAARAGASVVVQHTPNTEDWASSEGVAWRRAMDEARRCGEKQGVKLALENRAIFQDHHRHYALADPESLYRFAEKHDFFLTLDTSHAASWPWDVIEVYDLFCERLVNLHLSDLRPLPAWLDQPALHSYIKHHQLLGAGDLPLRDLIARVQADSYAGLVTLELSPIALQAWWPSRLRDNLESSASFVHNGGKPSPSRRRAVEAHYLTAGPFSDTEK